MKIRLMTAAAALALATPAFATSYVYAGSWGVDDGPSWTDNPLAYSAVGAAALLFGGSASDYAISTVDNDPLNINHMAHYNVIGVGPADFAENYFRGTEGVTHYQDVYIGDPSTDTVSAYVHDFGSNGRNYAFRITNSVPEPASWALMLGGFGLVGMAMRVRRKTVVTFA